MAKDNAIRDQKVFVRLGAVLELQKLYSESLRDFGTLKNAATPVDRSTLDLARRKRATLEQVIKLLELHGEGKFDG